MPGRESNSLAIAGAFSEVGEHRILVRDVDGSNVSIYIRRALQLRTTRYIYALIDVRDNSVRYVGVTKDSFARLGQHMLDAGKQTPKGQWLAELKARRLLPRLEILETVTGNWQKAFARERFWTIKLLQNGEPLVSATAANNALPLQFEEDVTIEDFRRDLGWSQNELARHARINANTVRRAENGEPVSSQTATAIAEAFSVAFGRRILVRDIDGLNVAL